MTYQVGGKEFDDWTAAQDAAVQLLDDGVEYVRVMQWNDERKTWGLIQELNLERELCRILILVLLLSHHIMLD